STLAPCANASLPGYRWLLVAGDGADRKRRRRLFHAAPPCARCRASCRQSKPDRRPGSPNATRGWYWTGSALPTRTGYTTLDARAAGVQRPPAASVLTPT